MIGRNARYRLLPLTPRFCPIPSMEVPGLYVSPQGWDDLWRITTKEETLASTTEHWGDVPLFPSPSAFCPGEVNDNPIPPDEDARNGLSDNQAATETDSGIRTWCGS
jgi:hypothetical protein